MCVCKCVSEWVYEWGSFHRHKCVGLNYRSNPFFSFLTPLCVALIEMCTPINQIWCVILYACVRVRVCVCVCVCVYMNIYRASRKDVYRKMFNASKGEEEEIQKMKWMPASRMMLLFFSKIIIRSFNGQSFHAFRALLLLPSTFLKLYVQSVLHWTKRKKERKKENTKQNEWQLKICPVLMRLIYKLNGIFVFGFKCGAYVVRWWCCCS